MRLFFSLALAALCLPVVFGARAQTPAPGAATPDELTFTNGDHLSGKLERIVGDTITFKSEMAGELTIPVAKVKELRTAGHFVALRKGVPLTAAQQPPTGSLQLADKTIELTDKGGVTRVPVADEAYVIDQASFEKESSQHVKLWQDWDGTITADGTLVRSSTNAQTVNVAANLVRAVPSVPYLPPRNRTTFVLNETYGVSTGVDTPVTTPATFSTTRTSIFQATLERDQYLHGKRSYFLATADFQHNFAQGLNLQQIYGAGFGYTVIKTPVQQLDTKVDAHYERQQFQDTGQNMNLIGATFAEDYSRTLPLKIKLVETANFIPAFNNLHAYAANLTAGFTLPAYKRLGVNFAVVDNYLNDAEYPYTKNSFQFTTGLTYALH